MAIEPFVELSSFQLFERFDLPLAVWQLLSDSMAQLDFDASSIPQNLYDRIRQPFAVGSFDFGKQYQAIDDGRVERIVETQGSIDRRAEFDRGTERRGVMAGGLMGGALGINLAITGNKEQFDRLSGVASAGDNLLSSIVIAGASNRVATGSQPARTSPLIEGVSRDIGYRNVAAETATFLRPTNSPNYSVSPRFSSN